MTLPSPRPTPRSVSQQLERRMGPTLHPPAQLSITKDTADSLTEAGIELLDGWLGYSRTYTVKPARCVGDGTRVAVKLYNDAAAHAHSLPSVPAKPRRAKPLDKNNAAAEYAREMNIVVRIGGEK